MKYEREMELKKKRRERTEIQEHNRAGSLYPRVQRAADGKYSEKKFQKVIKTKKQKNFNFYHTEMNPRERSDV